MSLWLRAVAAVSRVKTEELMSQRLLCWTAALLVLAGNVDAAPVESVFSIQGELREGSAPASGSYDIEASLFNVATEGQAIDVVTHNGVAVTDGFFYIELDYTTAPFEMGEQYWIEIAVRPAGSGEFVPLTPRTKLTASPYALGAVSVLPGAIGAEQINPSEVQARVDGACSVGQAIRSIGQDGSVTCDVDDDTTYSGTDFATSNQACTVGQVVRGFDQNGKVICAKDEDTTYSGTDFATSDQACTVGQVVRGIDQNGVVICAKDEDTTYSGTDFATSDQSCAVGQVVRGFDENGVVICATDEDTTYSGSDFALSDEVCSSGQLSTGVDDRGTVVCTLPPGIDIIPRPNYTSTAYDQGSDDIGFGLDMAIGVDGFPIMSYVDIDNGHLLVTHCEDPICQSSTTSIVDPAVGSGPAFTSIAINGFGQPVIGYHDADDQSLKLAVCNDFACAGSDETINTVDSGNVVGHYVSIGFGSDVGPRQEGYPILAYYDASLLDLKVAFCDTMDCSAIESIQVPDSDGDVGSHLSMVTKNTDPLISYYDATQGDLKYVRCSAFGSCSSSPRTIASDGNVGMESDIFLVGGRPTMAFQDDSGAIFVASCGNDSCSASLITVNPTSSSTSVFGQAPPAGVSASNGLPIIVADDTMWICSDPACSTGRREGLTVVSRLFSGDSAIAIDHLGYPVIATGRASQGIELVRCGSRTCREP